MITAEEILQALKQIKDPDLNQDIVSLGFVQNIIIEEGSVSLEIQLTTPACPVKEDFQTQAQQIIQTLKGVTQVKVKLTSRPTPKQTTSLQMSQGLNQVQSIIAISSCKGGVGKSTLAALMALDLAMRGHKVGLVDCDIHGPSIPTLFNAQNETVYFNENKLLMPIEKYRLKIMSFGFLLGDAPAVMRGPIVTRYIQQILQGTDWGYLDYLFIDMPPGTGDVQLTITQSLRLSGAVIITTRQTLSLIDVSRGILMFEKVSVPILGIIENMAYFVCDQCDKKHYIFGGQAGASLLDRFGLETLAEIPILHQLTHKIEHPITNVFISQAVDQMVRSLGKIILQAKQVPEIRFNQDGTTLKWPDGEEITVRNRDLRRSCRCAICVNELTGDQILKDEDIKGNIAPKTITPLGNYAIGIEWNDGHTSGIYPYQTIRTLVKPNHPPKITSPD